MASSKSKRLKPYNLENRTRLTAEPPLTAERLKIILGCALGSDYRPPGNAELSKLCSILNFWHLHFYQAQEDRTLNDLIDQALPAIESLAVVMPKIRDELAARDNRVNSQDQFLTWALRDAQQATSLLCRPITQWNCLQRNQLPDHAKDWRWLADVLPVDIETALRPTNPDYRGGHSKTGPLARVLADLIPILTGEQVTAVAVGTQLAKRSSPGPG